MATHRLQVIEPTVYGTTDIHIQDDVALPLSSETRLARRWKFAASGLALLCMGTLVMQQNDSISSSASISQQQIRDGHMSLQKQTDPANAQFYNDLEAFKNTSVDPCVDFYEYACGGWLATHDIPADSSSIDSSFHVVSEQNKQIVQQIIYEQPPVINEFYSSCSVTEELDTDAVGYVAKLIDSIHQANSTPDLLAYAGELKQSLGVDSFFSVFVGADPRDPATNVLQLSQGGLTFPSREYYLEDSKVSVYEDLFLKYVTDLFAVGDLDRHNVSAYAHAVLALETSFAQISLSNADLRDPWATNDAFTFAAIETQYPFLWAYLSGINKQEPFPQSHAIIATPSFFAAQNELFTSAELQQLKNFLSFHVIDSFASILGEYFRRTSHDFHGAITGSGSLPTREQFCVGLTTTYLGDRLGEYYMQKMFGANAKSKAKELISEIESSMKRLLKTEAWLDKITYAAAVEKLEDVKNFIGGPDSVPDLPFVLQPDQLFDNVLSIIQLAASQMIQSIGGPVDTKKWDMFPSTVNAYYDPSANKMVFPAAILQPPFYSADAFPAAANYARIGMVMGHELSHGFDDQGRNYDGHGALRSWWSPSVAADFTERAQCLAAQYSSFPVLSGDNVYLGNVNGELTLGENIADNGGLHLAYEAYQLWKSEKFSDGSAYASSQGSHYESSESSSYASLEGSNFESSRDSSSGSIEGSVYGSASEGSLTENPSYESAVGSDYDSWEGSGYVSIRGSESDSSEGGNSDYLPTEGSVESDESSGAYSPDVKPPKRPHKEREDEKKKEKSNQEKEKDSSGTGEQKEQSKHESKSKKSSKDEVEKDKKGSKKEEKKDKREDKNEEKKNRREKDEDDEDKETTKKEKKEKHDEDEKKHESKKEKHDEDEKKHENKKEKHDEDEKKHENKKEKYDEDEKKDEGEKEHHEEKKHDADRSEHAKDHHKKSRHAHDEDDEKKHESKHSKKDKHHGEKDKHHREKDKHHKHGYDDNNYDKEHEDKRYSKHERDEYDDHRYRYGRGEEEHEDKHHHRREDEHGNYGEHHHQHHHEHGRDRDEDYDGYKGKHHDDAEYGRYEHDDHYSHKHRYADRYDDDDYEYEGKHHGRHEYECDDCDGDYYGDYYGHHKYRYGHEDDDDDDYYEDRHHGRGKYDCEKYDCGRHHHLRSEYEDENARVFLNSMAKTLHFDRAYAEADPLADDRLFFTAFAQNWCEKRSSAYAELLSAIDPHSPGKWRVNGPLMNYDKFAAAFQCAVGTPMNPVDKCIIW